MQKIWRLTTAAIKNFSLFQFETVTSAQKSLETQVTMVDNNSDTATAAAAAASVTSSNNSLSEMVKFLEVVGNLKVSARLNRCQGYISIVCDILQWTTRVLW